MVCEWETGKLEGKRQERLKEGTEGEPMRQGDRLSTPFPARSRKLNPFVRVNRHNWIICRPRPANPGCLPPPESYSPRLVSV